MKVYGVVFNETTRINLGDGKQDYKKGTKLVLDRTTTMYACKNGGSILGEVEVEFKDIQGKLKTLGTESNETQSTDESKKEETLGTESKSQDSK